MTAAPLDPVLQQAARQVFSLYGRPVRVIPAAGAPVETLAVEEAGLDPFGDAGARAEVRRRFSFLVAEVRPEPGDQIWLDDGAEVLTVDAVESDDGIVREVWVR